MGDLAILIDGSEKAIIASAQGWESRQVEDPATEPVVRGPKDGFTEDLRTNTTLIRRRIKTLDLKMEPIKIGRLTKTDVVFAYMEGIVDWWD